MYKTMGAVALEAGLREEKLAGLRRMLAQRGVLVSPGAVPSADPKRGEEGLPTGHANLDAILPGGLPRRALTEVLGGAACGKTSLIVPAIAHATRSGGVAAFVDPGCELYPPALAALGVDLQRLLYVRPPAPDGDLAASLWAVEVLLQSGSFDAVVLDASVLSIRRRLADDRRAMSLRAAAEQHAVALVVLASSPLGAPPALRLQVTSLPGRSRRMRVVVEKSRYGWVGAEALVPASGMRVW